MRALHLDLGNVTPLSPNTALLIGTFDGVHIGHSLLVKEALKKAENVAVLLVYTNKKVTKEHQTSGALTSLEDRVKIFAESGASNVFLLNLGTNLLELSPEEFVNNVLLPLAPSVVVIGSDFRFGKGAKGHAHDLKVLGENHFETLVVSPLYYEGKKVSTSLIKKMLSMGKPDVAKTLLGRYYTLAGIVTKGYGLGNKLGFPTANIALDPGYFVPRHGVYFVRVKFKDNYYFGMASLGYHPTVNVVNVPLLEVNIFEFNENLYHDALVVEFITYLREEVKFDNVKELIVQLQKDRQNCENIIKRGEF